MIVVRVEVGDEVCVSSFCAGGGPSTGTVTQITPWKVRVLFPIHKYVWVPLACIEKIKKPRA
jgi:hypothetical protein